MSYCYTIASAQTTHRSRLCSGGINFRKRSVILETYKSDVMGVERPESTIRCRCYALCINDTHVQFASEKNSTALSVQNIANTLGFLSKGRTTIDERAEATK